MDGQRFVHRAHTCELGTPDVAPRILGATVLIGYALAFAGLAAIGGSGHAPGWISTGSIPTGVRIVLLALGMVHAVHGTVLAAEQIQRGWAILGQRAGAYPVLETSGPCRLVQLGSRWNLHLAFSEAPIWFELDETREREGLCFLLREADVARIARIFHPGEQISIRWIDLPRALGGPTLLGLRTALREERLDPVCDAPLLTGTDGTLKQAA